MCVKGASKMGQTRQYYSTVLLQIDENPCHELPPLCTDNSGLLASYNLMLDIG